MENELLLKSEILLNELIRRGVIVTLEDGGFRYDDVVKDVGNWVEFKLHEEDIPCIAALIKTDRLEQT